MVQFVNLAETMKLLCGFLKGSQPKCRVPHDRELSQDLRLFHLTWHTQYYPPSKKLHSQLLKYPQEVMPAMYLI